MKTRTLLMAGLAIPFAMAAAAPAGAVTFFHFNNGGPDGKLGSLSQPADRTHTQTETADDFVLTDRTRLTGASFNGLLPTGANASDIKDVEIEIYHVFPGDSKTPPDGRVTSRTNSPGDHEIAADTRDAGDGSLSFTTRAGASDFTVANTITTVHGTPEFTGGDGPATGQEMAFNINFDDPLLLDAGHFFFRPEVELDDGSFFWLSSGVPVKPDLQAWVRNDALAPDWVRAGTDVTHQGPFNMSFGLDGVTGGVPEPATWSLMIAGFGLIGAALRRNHRQAQALAA